MAAILSSELEVAEESAESFRSNWIQEVLHRSGHFWQMVIIMYLWILFFLRFPSVWQKRLSICRTCVACRRWLGSINRTTMDFLHYVHQRKTSMLQDAKCNTQRKHGRKTSLELRLEGNHSNSEYKISFNLLLYGRCCRNAIFFNLNLCLLSMVIPNPYLTTYILFNTGYRWL